MLVQSVTELEKLQHRIDTEASFVMPVFVDQNLHPAVNTISSLHILIHDDYYCVPINHPDAMPMSINLEHAHKIITLYKREILHTYNVPQERVYDVATVLHLSGKDIPEVRAYHAPMIARIMRQFTFKNLHLSVPLVIWMQFGKQITKLLQSSFNEIPEGYDFVNNTIIPTLTTIEKSGLAVDAVKLTEQFDKIHKYITNNTVYSEYNPYTVTGRPSNKYGGINFAAWNKTDGTRNSFVSRYGEDGILVQFDYEAFHLRLIAHQIGYTLPESSIHTYLAQQYYNKQEVTPDEYEQSKARTFALMYGINDDLGDVEFFHKVRKYSEQLWAVYNNIGYIKTKSGKKLVVEEATINKVFNYSIQWLETETALTNIANVCKLLKGRLTKPALYIYDALLLDLHRSETALLPRIKALLEEGGLHTRMYTGKNYGNLTYR